MEKKFNEVFYNEKGELIKREVDSEEFEEVMNYTINGELLDSKGKVLYDLTAIRIHMIDFGFDEFDAELYDYIKEQIEKVREEIDSDRDIDAAVRVICMQLMLGIEVKRQSIINDLRSGKIGLPEDFKSEICQKVLRERLKNTEDENIVLLEDKLFNPDSGESVLKITRGSK